MENINHIYFDKENIKKRGTIPPRNSSENLAISEYLKLKPGSHVLPIMNAEQSLVCNEMIYGASSIITDGKWTWTSRIQHYVEMNCFVLPKEFIIHAEKNKFRNKPLKPWYRTKLIIQGEKKSLSQNLKLDPNRTKRNGTFFIKSFFGEMVDFRDKISRSEIFKIAEDCNFSNLADRLISNSQRKGLELWQFDEGGKLMAFKYDEAYEDQLIKQNKVGRFRWFFTSKKNKWK